MVLCKLSSQFTDFVNSRSSNPKKILNQVSNAIDLLGELNVPLPGDAEIVKAFHETPTLSDDFMMSYLHGDMATKAKALNAMYEVLKVLERTGQVDKITARVIEKFIQSFTPIKDSEEPEELPEEITEELDKVATKFWKLLSLAGVIELTPDHNQRQLRLADRKFEWVKFALPENNSQKLEKIKDAIRGIAKKMRKLELLKEDGKMSEEEHLANFEWLVGQASELQYQMDELEKEKIPVWDLSTASDIIYIKNILLKLS